MNYVLPEPGTAEAHPRPYARAIPSQAKSPGARWLPTAPHQRRLAQRGPGRLVGLLRGLTAGLVLVLVVLAVAVFT